MVSPDVDETRLPGEAPRSYVDRLAAAKARAVAGPDRVVIGADTVVVHAGRVLGKPGHPEEARSMLRALQGTRHEVATGVAVLGPDGHLASVADVAVVTFLPMTEEEIVAYVETGEPMDKAGAYALQGRAARFIESVEGNHYTVIGFTTHLLARLMTAVGQDLTDFTNPGF